MKITCLPVFCLLSLALANSCQQDPILLPDVMNDVTFNRNPSFVINCPYPECDVAVAATKKQLQIIANKNCDTVWAEIHCCLNLNLMCALVHAVPDNPKCPYLFEVD